MCAVISERVNVMEFADTNDWFHAKNEHVIWFHEKNAKIKLLCSYYISFCSTLHFRVKSKKLKLFWSYWFHKKIIVSIQKQLETLTNGHDIYKSGGKENSKMHFLLFESIFERFICKLELKRPYFWLLSSILQNITVFKN